MLVAVHRDYYSPGESSSDRWTEVLNSHGIEVRPVDLYRPDVIEQLRGVDGLMWRFGHFHLMQQLARRVLRIAEERLGLTVYPDQHTAWHYDDKIAQAMLFQSLGVPAPQTWVWFRRADAEAALGTLKFPLVLKLSGGAASENVRRINGPDEAAFWVSRLFGDGVFSLSSADGEAAPWSLKKRIRLAGKALLLGQLPWRPAVPFGELHRGYLLLQEFLPDNPYDTRVTVIGRRAFGFRRFNRPDDFRASGSGRLDHDAQQIDSRFVRLAFETARKLRTQSCAIDGLYRGGKPVVGEVSYTFVNAAVAACPGRWELQDPEDDESFRWVDGSKRPEDAQCEDFIERLRQRGC